MTRVVLLHSRFHCTPYAPEDRRPRRSGLFVSTCTQPLRYGFALTLGAALLLLAGCSRSSVDAQSGPAPEVSDPLVPGTFRKLDPVELEGVTIHQFHHALQSGRMKRLFVAVPAERRPGWVIALNGSDSNGDGAWDLLVRGNSGGYQYEWALHAAQRFGVPVVAPDSDVFGAYEYPETFDSPDAQLEADLAAVLIAREFLGVGDMKPFVGGISWGGSRAMDLAGAIEVAYVYVASAQLDAAWDQRAIFQRDYMRLVVGSPAKHVRFSYGDPERESMAAFSNLEAILDGLVVRRDLTVSVHRHAGGHEIDLEDLMESVRDYAAWARGK